METDPYHKTSAKILDIYVYKLDNRDRKCPNVGSATDCSVRNDSLKELKSSYKIHFKYLNMFQHLLSAIAFCQLISKSKKNRGRTGIPFIDT